MPDELPPEIREHHSEAADEYDRARERAYNNFRDTIKNSLGDNVENMRRTFREATVTRDNALLDAHDNLIRNISQGENAFCPDKVAELLSNLSTTDSGIPGRDFRQRPDGSPEYGNGWNRPERTENENISSNAFDHESIRRKYNNFIAKFGGTNTDGIFTRWTRNVLGKGPSLRFDKEIKKRLGSKKYSQLERNIKDMQDAVNSSERSFINNPKSSRWNPEDKAKFERASSNIDALLKDLGDDWDRQRDKSNAMSGDPSKVGGEPKTKTRLETIYKIMKLLSVIGLGIFAYITIEQYCANHTGCLKVMYSGSGATQNNIYYCNSINSTESGKTVFLPAQCFCSQLAENDIKATHGCECGQASACESGSEPPNWTTFTADNKNQGNVKCIPSNGQPPKDGGEWIYYSYQTMTPIDGVLDIAGKSLQLGSDLIKMIIHAVIVIGIIIGVLLVLWIIYKVVANRKPAETLKIETGSSTVSKFGNRGYIGNLSKYSNYAYMGRCVAQPVRPYIKPRFKF